MGQGVLKWGQSRSTFKCFGQPKRTALQWCDDSNVWWAMYAPVAWQVPAYLCQGWAGRLTSRLGMLSSSQSLQSKAILYRTAIAEGACWLFPDPAHHAAATAKYDLPHQHMGPCTQTCTISIHACTVHLLISSNMQIRQMHTCSLWLKARFSLGDGADFCIVVNNSHVTWCTRVTRLHTCYTYHVHCFQLLRFSWAWGSCLSCCYSYGWFYIHLCDRRAVLPKGFSWATSQKLWRLAWLPRLWCSASYIQIHATDRGWQSSIHRAVRCAAAALQLKQRCISARVPLFHCPSQNLHNSQNVGFSKVYSWKNVLPWIGSWTGHETLVPPLILRLTDRESSNIALSKGPFCKDYLHTQAYLLWPYHDKSQET